MRDILDRPYSPEEGDSGIYRGYLDFSPALSRIAMSFAYSSRDELFT
jgi:hypothetical protein